MPDEHARKTVHWSHSTPGERLGRVHLRRPTEDRFVEGAQGPLDVDSGKNEHGHRRAAAYPEGGGTKEPPAQTRVPSRTQYDEICFPFAGDAKDLVMNRFRGTLTTASDPESCVPTNK